MKCKVEGCEREEKYIGMCGMHYKRWWRHGDVNYCDDRTKPVNLEKCLADGCEERGAVKGYCNLHYLRWSKYGRTELLPKKGPRWVHSSGYVMMRVNGRLTYEHIYLAEQALGKPLPKGAVVHHTGKKHENKGFFKLVVCPNQAYHRLIHDRAKELGYEGN